MSTLAHTPSTRSAARRRPHLSGMAWLTWRQHRAAYRVAIVATLSAGAWMLYQGLRWRDFLRDAPPFHDERYSHEYMSWYLPAQLYTGLALYILPLLLGVFLGAPLLAADRDNGTAKLVVTQSVSRVRWMATRLAVTALVVVVCTGVLSAAFTWWWQPHGLKVEWYRPERFATTGPMPVALALATTLLGALIGFAIGRTLPAMVITLGASTAVLYVSTRFRGLLGVRRTISGPLPDPAVRAPEHSAHVDHFFTTASGRQVPLGKCSPDPIDSCLAVKGVVHSSVKYFDLAQRDTLQWTGAAFWTAVALIAGALTVWWAARRPL
ncbi:ABC transporter [Embleya sp. NPDC005575]|uniref:ABC transporter n=1 Tax=Embleya sp. NPDC005575 TaxID=3156892 RepID=UPI00339F6663